MDLLDSHSPIEALAFNYLSFGFLAVVNNLWAWLAVFTAALSIWRLKSIGAAASSTVIHKTSSITHSIHRSTDESETSAADVPSVRNSWRSIDYDEDGDGESDGVLKGGKIRVCYLGENVEDEDELMEEEEEDELYRRNGGGNGGGGGGGEWWEWWEGELKMKKGEMGMGWYSYQDLKMINGNVVKLWDGGAVAGERYIVEDRPPCPLLGTTVESGYGRVEYCSVVWW